MLVYSIYHNAYVIDPHYLEITPIKKVWDWDNSLNKEIATALLVWMYNAYNPRSPFKNYQKSKRPHEAYLAQSFPEWYVKKQEKIMRDEMERAIRQAKEDAVAKSDAKEGEPAKKKKTKLPVDDDPETRSKLLQLTYDPEKDPIIQDAIEWYTQRHLKQTSLWYAAESFAEAMYNLGQIVRDPDSTAQEIKAASQELEQLPRRKRQMEEQAEKDEAHLLKVVGEKDIKRHERLPENIRRRGLKKPPGDAPGNLAATG
jgi:cell division protein FtsB